MAAALALPLLGLRAPLIEIDDARYAEVPRAMAASGDWVLPRLNDMPYVEKPPLWYWLGAASMRVFGTGEGPARLPMTLLAWLGALGVWWLGSWLYCARVAAVAVLALATAGLWLFLTHNLTLDLPVSVFLLWTTALVLRVLERPEDARWAAPAAWAAAALAFLSKGLISVLFPALWAAALALLFPRWRKNALKLISPAG
ncbi:MAG: glycosyltransferase family 39 protein, partial [Elusimicrobia bacterium]|nr:glycosyltransferase family 39 protein [Elusimicrobiota bacterium]